MGAGTGPLSTRGNTYEVTLTFDHGQISKTDPIYEHFKSALDWLLEGLSTTGASGESTEHPVGSDFVTHIDVVVRGPLPQPKKFNRAFNRLLWGVRHQKSPLPPGGGPSGRTVKASPQTWQDENT
jgi:hypothetical protein